jgi:hypothetical protein
MDVLHGRQVIQLKNSYQSARALIQNKQIKVNLWKTKFQQLLPWQLSIDSHHQHLGTMP